MQKLLNQINRLPGPWLIFTAAVLWSTVGGVSKSLAMDPLLFAGLRSLIGGLVLLPMLQPKKLVWDKWLAGLILAYTAVTSLVLLSMRYTTAGNIIALQDSALVWVFVWALVIGRQKMNWRRILPVAAAVLGIIIFLLEPNQGGNAFGNLLGVGAGICFAAMGACMRQAKAATPLSLVVLMNLCCGVLILLILVLLPGYTLTVPPIAWPVLLLMGTVQLSGSYLCYCLGLRKIEHQRAQLLCTWELVLTPVWAFLMVGELPTIYGLAGWITMLAAIVLDSLLRHPQARQAVPTTARPATAEK